MALSVTFVVFGVYWFFLSSIVSCVLSYMAVESNFAGELVQPIDFQKPNFTRKQTVIGLNRGPTAMVNVSAGLRRRESNLGKPQLGASAPRLMPSPFDPTKGGRPKLTSSVTSPDLGPQMPPGGFGAVGTVSLGSPARTRSDSTNTNQWNIPGAIMASSIDTGSLAVSPAQMAMSLGRRKQVGFAELKQLAT